MYKTISIFFLAALMLGLAAVASAGDGPADAAMWLKLDETSGTLASDLTINNNDGTLSGGAVFDPDTDTSRMYDTGPSCVRYPWNPEAPEQATGVVRVPHSTTLNAGMGAVTMCFFIKLATPINQFVRPEVTFIQKGSTSANDGDPADPNHQGRRYQMYYKGNQVNSVVDDNTTKMQYQTAQYCGIESGEWVHVAATIDMVAMQARFYLDGNVIAATVLGGWPLESIDEVTDLFIGNNYPGEDGSEYPDGFKGSMDDIRIYLRALNQSEIQDISEPPPTPTPTVTPTPTPAQCASIHWEIFD